MKFITKVLVLIALIFMACNNNEEEIVVDIPPDTLTIKDTVKLDTLQLNIEKVHFDTIPDSILPKIKHIIRDFLDENNNKLKWDLDKQKRIVINSNYNKTQYVLSYKLVENFYYDSLKKKPVGFSYKVPYILAKQDGKLIDSISLKNYWSYNKNEIIYFAKIKSSSIKDYIFIDGSSNCEGCGFGADYVTFDGKKLHEIFAKPDFFTGFNSAMKGFTQTIDSREVLSQKSWIYKKLNVVDTTFLIVDIKGDEIWFESEEMKGKVQIIKKPDGSSMYIYKGRAFNTVMSYYYDKYKIDQYYWNGKEMKFVKTIYKKTNFFVDKEPHNDKRYEF